MQDFQRSDECWTNSYIARCRRLSTDSETSGVLQATMPASNQSCARTSRPGEHRGGWTFSPSCALWVGSQTNDPALRLCFQPKKTPMDIYFLAEWPRVRANASWGDTPRSKHIYFPGKSTLNRTAGRLGRFHYLSKVLKSSLNCG